MQSEINLEFRLSCFEVIWKYKFRKGAYGELINGAQVPFNIKSPTPNLGSAVDFRGSHPVYGGVGKGAHEPDTRPGCSTT
jgi:hypothetical protein